jgi:lipoyl-dependent peroxiredoxin
MQLVPRIERSATARWEGSVARGAGSLSVPSAAFGSIPFSLPGRTAAEPTGGTSPEELLAAAHAGCFAMAAANELTRRQCPPDLLTVVATTALDEVDGRNRIVASSLHVSASHEALTPAVLEEALAAADARCPFSALIRDAGGSVVIESGIGDPATITT